MVLDLTKMDPNVVGVNSRLAELKDQRDRALDECVVKASELALLEQRAQVAEAKVKDLAAKVEELAEELQDLRARGSRPDAGASEGGGC